MLHELLSDLANRYTYERAKPFAGSEFGNFVRHDIAIEAKKNLLFWPFDLTVKASVGAGVWAAVPWLGFFDPLVTDSATRGYYVVYLINAQSNEIFLSMNQGTTAVYNEFGESKGQEVLQRRALDMRQRVIKAAAHFDSSPIDLGSEDRLPRGYMAGHSFGRRYKAGSISAEQFIDDLYKMLSAYETLTNFGGTTPSDVMQEEAPSTEVEEVRKYFLSKRIERAPNVRRQVLERRGSKCEGCGVIPEIHLKYSGPLINTPLDVHHKSAISQLKEGESRRYKIPDDFLVLCPNCHRLIHKQDNTSDLNALKNSLAFTLTAKKSPHS